MPGASQTYYELTARPITPKMQTWLYELIERFGDERVVAAMRSLAGTGDIDKLLERVRKTLATEDARHAAVAPIELDRDQLMAVVRGEAPEPTPPYTYDWHGLTHDEYTEVIAWSTRRLEAKQR